MKVLLTGATGLIGKEVGKKLVEAGHTVIALSRNPSRAKSELPFPADVFAWSGQDSKIDPQALKDIEAVVHLAGESVAGGRWTAKRKKQIFDSRVTGTRMLIDALREHSPKLKTFLQGSAIGFYGNRGDEVLDENSEAGKGFLADVVRAWEAEADRIKTFPTLQAVRLVKVRSGVVFSRQGGAMDKLIPLFARGLGGKLATGQQWMSWIHLEDIARVFEFALENPAVEGAVNAVAPEAVRNLRFTVEFARAMNKPVFLPAPEAALRIALGEMAATILDSQRVAPAKLLALGFNFTYPDLIPTLQLIAEPLRDGQHEMFAEQWVPFTPQEIFPYFCSEKNLEELTPAFLGFNVVGKSTPLIEQGTLIDYRLSFRGVPMKWQTRIEEWSPGVKFVDTQLKGPYTKWHHTHEFLPFAGGTLMRDRVLYKLPLGIVGDVAASWKVTGDVQKIFAHRRAVIEERFGARQ